jgi:Domain of unknown function (DUF4148)
MELLLINRQFISPFEGKAIMKKALVCLSLAAVALTAPVLSFAQSNGPLTRAEVRADLVRVEQAGYNPALGNDLDYPADIQAAEAKIAAQDNQHPASRAYGGVTDQGNSSSGAPRRVAMHSVCVGPVSFCTPYFGS